VSDLGRRIAVPLAVVFALAAPAVQALQDVGLSAAEFSQPGASTLRAAGYAFSIWSVIYAGLVAYAVFQAAPGNAARPALRRVGWPSVLAIAGCGAWICASALNARWATVAIIVASAVALTVSLCRAARAGGPVDLRERLFVWWPLNLLAGWLTIASALNILTVLTAEGLLSGVAKAAAFIGVAAVLIVALAVLRIRHMAVFGVPIAWGLAAVWAAERHDKGDVAALAMAAAVLVAAFAAWRASRPSPILD